MSTLAQGKAYGKDHGTQSQQVLRFVTDNYLCTIDAINLALGIPKGTVTARLSDHLKSGAIGMYEPDNGNTQYFATETVSERQREAYKYKKRNHPVTKLYKRLKKEGYATPSIYAKLLEIHKELTDANYQP